MCVEHRVPAAAGKVHRRPYRCVCVCSLCMTWCDGVNMCMRDLCVYVCSPGVASDLCFSPNNNMLMISVGMDAVIRCYDIQQRKYARYKLSFCLLEFTRVYHLRTVTQVSAPAALGAVTMLQDGTTLLAGGADGMYNVQCTSVIAVRIIMVKVITAVENFKCS